MSVTPADGRTGGPPTIDGFRTFVVEVVAVDVLGPQLRAVTFGGSDLAGYVSPGPDAFLFLLLAPPGRLDLRVDQSFSWTACFASPEEERPVGAYYTVRRWDPDRRTLEMHFVLHDHGGHASNWARAATVGDEAALWGPRTAFAPPPGTDRYLLVGDETGLPAVASILEWLPDDVPVDVVAVVDEPASAPTLPARPGATVHWSFRDACGGHPGRSAVDVVRSLSPLGDATYVWGGGESRMLTAVRKHVRHERGLPRQAVSLIAYWRRRAPGAETDPLGLLDDE